MYFFFYILTILSILLAVISDLFVSLFQIFSYLFHYKTQ
jgi:hypothetical protein